jgi:hypothetical protein
MLTVLHCPICQRPMLRMQPPKLRRAAEFLLRVAVRMARVKELPLTVQYLKVYCSTCDRVMMAARFMPMPADREVMLRLEREALVSGRLPPVVEFEIEPE